VWVRLKAIQYLSENGRQVTRYPGEWVQVGNQLARQWIANGDADRPDMPDMQAMPGCGIVLTSAKACTRPPGGLELVHADQPELAFANTLVWSGVNFRGDLLTTGFTLLDTWEVAAPILSYTILARDIGSDEDRAATCDVVRDLRVPVYDVRFLFLRRCDATRRLLKTWHNEAGDRSLAFLRALYRVKPLLCALPTTWVLP
jgi:hypothetical protein